MESFKDKLFTSKPSRPEPTGQMVVPSDSYTKSAMDKELEVLASTVVGRNNQLNISALKLAGLPIDRWTLRQKLIEACEVNGLTQDDGGYLGVEKTIDSAFGKADRDGPRMIPERPAQQSDAPRMPSVQAAENAQQEAGGGGDNPFGDTPPVDGANWMFDADDTVVELWGSSDQILWAEGEALMICGGMGLGKSTLAGMLLRAQLGLRDTVLDLPVTPVDKPILYLAMDRPRQLRRAMRRQFSEEEKELIAGKLLIRPGPPVMDMAIDPSLLARMAEAVGAGVVYVDSLKDAVVGLSADETAANYNRARQKLLASGVEVCELHHTRKPSAEAPGGISSVYGSTWLASGAGSVILLSGEPGDLVVKFRHAKTPANEVGPWHLLLDPERGEFAVQKCDLLVVARGCGSEGLSADEAAKVLYDTRRPSASEKKKAERQLANLESKGLLTRVAGRGGDVFFPIENRLQESQLSGEMF
ncbi:RepA-like helicase [Mycobacterium phage Nebkiss]|nr:RepA-like helicase [Mycobacterium phage Nebkiss]